MAQDYAITLEKPLDFVERIIAEYNAWLINQPLVSEDNDFISIDLVLGLIDEFSQSYGVQKQNDNLRFVVLGVLLSLVYQAVLDDENDNDTIGAISSARLQ